jgi:hypothetical protein
MANAQGEFMYDHNSLLIAGALLAVMLLAIWLGSRLGLRRTRAVSPQERDQVTAIQASLLGLLALLLGFTFSLALQRYDDRTRAVVAEANAIGTAWLRTDLLDEPARAGVRAALRAYVAARIAAADVSLIETAARSRLDAEATAAFRAAWTLTAAEARRQGGPVPMGLVAALTEMSDAYGARIAALDRHVPELVLGLLFLTLIWGPLMATALLAALPVVALYLVAQRQLISAFTTSGVR